MTKRPRTLTAAFVRTIGRPGVYGDGRGGRGLSLQVHRTTDGRIVKTWRQRVRTEGRMTSIGLGPYPEVTLAEARQKAPDNSRRVRLGQDPRGRSVPTFEQAAERTIRLHRDAWKDGSSLPEQWASTFRLHAAPLLDKPVDRITSADVLRCLGPIWNSKPAAARKARHRIAAVFRWCIGRNHRRDNPVDLAVAALPKANVNGPRHHRALPPDDRRTSDGGAVRRTDRVDRGSTRGETLVHLETDTWGIVLREIEGERFVVLPAGTPDYPPWTVRDRPAVKLSRE